MADGVVDTRIMTDNFAHLTLLEALDELMSRKEITQTHLREAEARVERSKLELATFDKYIADLNAALDG